MTEISTPYYKILDVVLVFSACSVAYWIRFDTPLLPLYYFLPTAIFAITSTFALSITKFYSLTNSQYSLAKILAGGTGLIFAALLTMSCLYLTKTGQDYSRIWLTISTVLSLIFIVGARLILELGFNISMGSRVVVLLGRGETVHRIAKELKGNTSGIRLASIFEIQYETIDARNSSLANVDEFIESYRQDEQMKHAVSEIWITHDVFSRIDPDELEHQFNDSAAKLVYIPEMPKIHIGSETQIEVVLGMPTINSSFSKNQKLDRLIKLIEDQLIAWLTLILLLPLFILISILIKIDSSGPVFYKQIRYGLSGKSFTIWKFRTMKVNNSDDSFVQASENDTRITRVGFYLRRASLDELPQLLNVISGTMSLVGPRPHPVELNEYYRQL